MNYLRKTIKKALSRCGYLLRRRNPSEILSASLHLVSHPNGDCKFLVINPADAIQRHHSAGKFYELQILRLIETHFNGGTFLDIGANVGNHSIFVAKTFPDAKVIAFEPHPDAFAVLSANVSFNRLSDRISLVNKALSDTYHTATIRTPAHNLGGSTLELDIRGKSKADYFDICGTVIGDDYLDTLIDFIKLDVEGHELKVLSGLSNTIKEMRPTIFVEVDERTDCLVQDFLFNLGYREEFRDKNFGLVRQVLYLPISHPNTAL